MINVEHPYNFYIDRFKFFRSFQWYMVIGGYGRRLGYFSPTKASNFGKPYFRLTHEGKKMLVQPLGPQDPNANNRQKKNLTEPERIQCISILLSCSKDGKLEWGAHQKVAKLMGIAPRISQRLWKNRLKHARQGVSRVKIMFPEKKSNPVENIFTTPQRSWTTS